MTAREKGNRVTDHLSAESRDFYRRISDGWELAEDGKQILVVACEALDRLREAQGLLKRDGLVIKSGKTTRLHPAAGVEKEARLAFLRAVRQLNLDGAGDAVPKVK